MEVVGLIKKTNNYKWKFPFLTSSFMLSLPTASTLADPDYFIWGDQNLYSSIVSPLRIPASSRLIFY